MEKGNVKNSGRNKRHLSAHDVAFYADCLICEDIEQIPAPQRRHVEDCPQCKDAILDIGLFLQKNRNQRKPRPAPIPIVLLPETIKTQGRTHWMTRVAASFFIVALLTAVYYTIGRRDETTDSRPAISRIGDPPGLQTPGQRQPVASPKPVAPETIAGTSLRVAPRETSPKTHSERRPFLDNPNLEYMVNSSSRNPGVRVFSPQNNSSQDVPITFRWDLYEKQPVQLKILNNQNEVLYTFTPKSQPFILQPALPPGLYYWKLENPTDLLYVGKFRIPRGSIARPK